MKNIILCFDGTWNKPDYSGNDGESTNVYLLSELLSKSDKQLVYYDEGVGCEWYDRIIGGVSGAGLSDNIKQAYEYLSAVWMPGDKVFLFGFSRGAYTARSLGGMLYSCGLNSSPQRPGTEVAFNIYKNADKNERAAYKSKNVACPVEVVGVWDTVGALGIPLTLLKGINSKFNQFHDTKLNKEVKFAYHALALDEQRSTFTPTLWDEDEITIGQKIEQVWFSGVHSDIGGGYPEKFLSDISLKWMMEKLKDMVSFSPAGYTFSTNSLQGIHDSYQLIFGPRVIRSLPLYGRKYPVLHESVLQMLKRKNYKALALCLLKNRNELKPYRVAT